MTDKGLLELVGGIAGGIAGLYYGYEMGSEAIEYAKTIAENPDTLAHVINLYPYSTILITSLGLSKVTYEVGAACGAMADSLLETD